MKKLLYIFSVVLFILACEGENKQQNNTTTDPEPAAEQLKVPSNPAVSNKWICIPGKQVGQITPNTSEKALVEIFGAENVKRQQLSLDEGIVTEGTVVYPGSPNQLTVEWLPGELYEKPAIVRIEGEGAKWLTSQGISIGTKMEELLSINEVPVSFFGFDWEYSGLVDDWGDGGQIDQDLVIFLAPGKPDAIYPDLLGDQMFTSDHPKVKDAELYVISMMIPLNEETVQE